MAVRYVKAIHDFKASQTDEVSLRIGDIVRVIKEVDGNWSRGIVRRKEGIFPINFVQHVQLPEVEKGQKLFVAVENFDGGQDGDLRFRRGDFIIGTAAVDQNWWEGRSTVTHLTGIFPLTHVEELLHVPHSQGRGGKQTGHILASAIVVRSLHPEVDGELELVEGDTVKILKFYNESFALGCCNGKTGQFPLSFVCIQGQGFSKPQEPDVMLCGNVQNNNGYLAGKKSHSRKGSYTQANTRSHDSFVIPYGQTLYQFTAVNENELAFDANEIITLISHIDDDWIEGEINGCRGIFPACYVNIIVDCQSVEDNKVCKSSVSTIESKSDNISSDTYGRVLYDFIAEASDELSLHEGDTVTIIQQLDSDWYLAQHDDSRIGRCPVSYVEVFGCEPLRAIISPTSPVSCQEDTSDPILRTNIANSVTHNEFPGMASTGFKPKPTVKPKPMLQSSLSTSHDSYMMSQINSGDFRRHSCATTPSSSCAGKAYHNNSQLSRIQTSSMQKQQTDFCTSLDEIVQSQLRQAKTKVALTTCINESGATVEQTLGLRDIPTDDILVRKQAIIAKSEQREAPLLHQMSKSPVATPRTLRPVSLNVGFEPNPSKAKLMGKMKLEPPTRPSGSKLSPNKPKIIPKRPAPPRPSSTLHRASRSANDLMAFSPEQNSFETSHGSSSSPMMESERHHPCLQSSSTTLANREQADSVDKRHEKRQKIIGELFQTELDYMNSLVLCLKTFSGNARHCPPSIDLEMLFGNADEVVELSQRLFTSLEQNVEGKAFEEQCVGKCFIELKDQFQSVYAHYCRNHDSVIALLEKYEGVPEVFEFFQSVLNQIRQHSTVFDLSSILIKPVQRILKYPLFLSELDHATEDSHVDKIQLGAAICTMTSVASYINEYKRRKDLVFKYKQETDIKFSDKISRLTMHSTMKKLYRISRKMVGIQTVDDQFNQEEMRFKALDITIRNLTRDISQYIEQCQDSVECKDLLAVNILELYSTDAPELKIDKFCEVHSQISQMLLLEFKAEVESEVLPPLNSLLLMYQGPHKVIRKRYDKLLDYDNATARLKNLNDSDQVKAMNEELLVARHNYEALNAQLLDDLPKLYNLSMEVMMSCLHKFIDLQQRFHKQALDKIHDLLGLQLLLSSTSSSSNIIEAFNIAHAIMVEKMSDMSFIPKTFNPQVEEVRRMKDRKSKSGTLQPLVDVEMAGSQCEGQKVFLRQKYPTDRLFLVSQDFVGSQTMDLNLTAGSLVGVIKEGDPMGNKDRWFVDNGADKGFIQKQFLVSKQPTANDSTSNSSVDLLDWLGPSDNSSSFVMNDVFTPLGSSYFQNPSLLDGATSGKLPNQMHSSSVSNWIKFADDSLPASSQTSLQNGSSSSADNQSPCARNNLFQAIYQFQSRGGSELSINEGEIVHVLEKQDLDGNPEWWHVEREDGQRGYVPANYFYEVH